MYRPDTGRAAAADDNEYTLCSVLRELKEHGIIRFIKTIGESNDADLFTKNLPGPAFNKHTIN